MGEGGDGGEGEHDLVVHCGPIQAAAGRLVKMLESSQMPFGGHQLQKNAVFKQEVQLEEPSQIDAWPA